VTDQQAQRLTVTLGTAGHIDHGKTALVHFLTGCNTDRLPEEQRRGMSIDLGFAPCLLGDRQVGIVDVPGHERFIRNMVAGATGIDAVMLVIAADDGIMPQTREHFEVIELLGVRHGLVALTKVDKARELVPLVTEDIRQFLGGTFLEQAPIVPVSAVTGEGIGELRAELERLVAQITPRPACGPFRMPIENVFTVKGFGTVITGIPVSGTVRVGETLEILPGGQRGRVRGLQVYQETTQLGRAGECVAINLADVPHQELGRGQVAAAPGSFRPALFCQVRLRHLASAGGPLRASSAVKLHTGTVETNARLSLLDRKSLAPGEGGLAQLQVEQPVVVQPGDHFVVRSLAPVRTIGGGVVLGCSERRRRALKDWVLADLAAAESALGDRRGRVELALKRQVGLPTAELAQAAGLTAEETTGVLAELVQAGLVCRTLRPEAWVHAERLAEVEAAVLGAVERWHGGHPLALGIDRPALQREVAAPPQVIELAVSRLVGAERLQEQGPYLAQGGWQVRPSAQEQVLLDKLAAAFAQAGMNSPSEKDFGHLAAPERVRQARQLLCDTGVLVRVPDGTLFHRAAIEQAERLLREHLGKQGEISMATFRDLAGTSRRYALSVLEHFDRLGITVRTENVRRLRRG